ncbi:hypothetical protein BU17DRAFT_70287 [Hysterangium stoloniferum]|nr:hypothetical protein BU17DRAFT_70287 [Hysterangium stoloniferum]
MDGDIMFLGNWSSQDSSSSSFVSAIVLTPLNKSASGMDITRTFSRSQSLIVHVGRHVSNDMSPPADDKATFSNPVMSRNHAKITFSDSGPAFVIDTNSHHGTWVTRTRSGQFKLEPESPYQLQDDDKITFGKEVQRDDNVKHCDFPLYFSSINDDQQIYKPLTVSVKLLSIASTPSSMSISSAEASPVSNFNSPKRRNRFGLSPSSDESGSSSDSEHSDSGTNQACKGSNADEEFSLRNLQSPEYHTPDSSNSSSDGLQMSDAVSSPPRLELEGAANPTEERDSSPVINLNSHSTVVLPPWRLVNAPWASLNAKIRRHMPDVLTGPPSRFDRISGHDHHLPFEDSYGHHTHFDGHGNTSRHNQHDHDHEGSNSFREEITSLSDIVNALKTDMASLKETFEKGDDLAKNKNVLDKMEELFGQLRTKLMQDVDGALSANINGFNAIKDTVTSLQNEMTTLKLHKGAVQTDLRFLRSDHDVLQSSANGIEKRLDQHDVLMSDLREDIEHLRDAGYFDDNLDTILEKEKSGVNSDLLAIKANVQAVEDDLRALLIAMEDRNSDDSVNDISSHLAVMKAELQSLVQDEIKAQLKAAMDNEQLSPVLGKRKRGADDEHDTAEETAPCPIAIISNAPPRKRLRMVANCVTAGAIGAIGAWIGLAFL